MGWKGPGSCRYLPLKHDSLGGQRWMSGWDVICYVLCHVFHLILTILDDNLQKQCNEPTYSGIAACHSNQAGYYGWYHAKYFTLYKFHLSVPPLAYCSMNGKMAAPMGTWKRYHWWEKTPRQQPGRSSSRVGRQGWGTGKTNETIGTTMERQYDNEKNLIHFCLLISHAVNFTYIEKGPGHILTC